MNLTLRARALDLREAGFTYKDIASILRVNMPDLTRFFNASDHIRYSARSLVNTSKLKAGEAGELDFDIYDRKEEGRLAAEKWFVAMRGARWDVRRRENEG